MHGRWLGWLHAEGGRQIQRTNVRPPRIEVIHDELHHEVFRPLLLKKLLENELTDAHTKNCHLAIQQFCEAKRFIEAFGDIEILRGKKRTGSFRAGRNSRIHGFSWLSSLCG